MNVSELTNDTEKKQFSMQVDGSKAFIDYSLNNGEYQLLHAEVPPPLRGSGAAKILVEQTFDAIEQEGRTAFARCSYVRHVAQGSTKWDDIVSY